MREARGHHKAKHDAGAVIPMRPGQLAILFLLALTWLQPAIHAAENGAQRGTVPSRHFFHTAWSTESNLGAVFDIEQASDGFLWLTTSTGIFRFDGLRFESVDEATNGAIPSTSVNILSLARNGGVWFSTRSAGLLHWNKDRVQTFPDRRCTPAQPHDGIAEGLDGSLWIHASGGLSLLRGSHCDHMGPEQGFPAGFVEASMMDRRGTFWVMASGGALLRVRNGQSTFEDSGYTPGPSVNDSFLREAPDGAIWLSDDRGLRRVVDGAGNPSPIPSPVPAGAARFGDFVFDRDGALWAATQDGVRRFSPEQVTATGDQPIRPGTAEEAFGLMDGLSSDAVRKIFVDKEGSVWVGTTGGLDRLRRTPLTTVVLPHTQEVQFAVAPGDHGSVWLGSASMPLAHLLADGTLVSYPGTVKPQMIRRDFQGRIWASGEGPKHLWVIDEKTQTPVSYPGEEQALVVASGVDRNGDPWLSRVGPEIFYRHANTWAAENKTLGRKPNVLGATAGDAEGNVWFAFSNQLVEWTGTEFHRYSFEGKNVSAATLFIRGPHVWLAGEGGLQLFANGQFHIMQWKDPALPGRISGVVETPSGDMWLNGFSGVTRVSAAELSRWLQNPGEAVAGERLNALDGLPGLASERFPEPSVVQGDDGKLWFATAKGLAWLDPRSLQKTYNPIPPPVEVSSIRTDGHIYPEHADLTLPPRTQNIEIAYTALSLAMPERVAFRYKLEGVDDGWQEADQRRQAFYTKLRPGRYVFQVIARNNSGVWNNEGATLVFTVAPAWYQTVPFYAACFVAAFLIVMALYQLRVRQVHHAVNARFDERLAERTRMARELHDTFLQTVQGSKMVADDALAEGTDEARMRNALVKLSGWLGQAVTEGRAALHALRASTVERNDLARSLRRAADETIPSSMTVDVHVTGESRDLHPIVRDELWQIGFEAIRNAAQHSKGTHLQIDLLYSGEFVLRVKDNGIGILPEVAEAGKERHFGLAGMRERATRIRGKLSVRSCAEGGTEVAVSVPGSIVYEGRK